MTHQQREPDARKLPKSRFAIPHKGPEGRPIRIDGTEYLSIKDARRKLKKGAKTIQRWLDRGDAQYI